MEPPKNWGTRILEFGIAVALSGFLIKLGVEFIICVWKPLLVIAGIVVLIIVVYRLYKYFFGGGWGGGHDEF